MPFEILQIITFNLWIIFFGFFRKKNENQPKYEKKLFLPQSHSIVLPSIYANKIYILRLTLIKTLITLSLHCVYWRVYFVTRMLDFGALCSWTCVCFVLFNLYCRLFFGQRFGNFIKLWASLIWAFQLLHKSRMMNVHL